MKYLHKYVSAYLLGVAALAVGAAPAWAQTAPNLGVASGFAALGGTGVTCTSPDPATGITVSGGDVGSGSVEPTTVTGFPGFTPGANACSLDAGRTPLLGQTAAITALGTAYNALDANNPCPADAAHNLTGNLIGKTLSPGVYCIHGTGLLTGQLTLAGSSTGIWIFKADTDLTPIGGSVVMANGGNACNVYWRIGTAVSLNNSDFLGNILAGTAITFTGVGSSLKGRALALGASVTMTGANISACTGGVTPPPSCDKDCKHHKHCKHEKHHKHHKPNCDAEHGGHDKDGHDNHDDDNDGNDNDNDD